MDKLNCDGHLKPCKKAETSFRKIEVRKTSLSAHMKPALNGS